MATLWLRLPFAEQIWNAPTRNMQKDLMFIIRTPLEEPQNYDTQLNAYNVRLSKLSLSMHDAFKIEYFDIPPEN